MLFPSTSSQRADVIFMNMENEDLSPDLMAFLRSRNVGDGCIARFVETSWIASRQPVVELV